MIKKSSMKKISTLLVLMSVSVSVHAQNSEKPSDIFWNQLQKHCGKAYEGQITAGAREGDGFSGKKLVMQVLSCKKDEIKIPFHVGDNHSRTWVLTKTTEGVLKLKHDHRHEDGSEDKITQYGGTSTSTGSKNLQFFPADQETANLLDYAATNVWWIGLDENQYTYNLQRVGSERVFTVRFDLSKEVTLPPKPWGWK